MMNDKLDSMFDLRKCFMTQISQKFPNTYPKWPIDLKDKEHQQHVRDMALRGVEEMFEALQHLKNWKPHRVTEIPDFDKSEFLEEIVDAFNYFLSVLVLTGTSSEDLYNAYTKKDRKIHQRLEKNY